MHDVGVGARGGTEFPRRRSIGMMVAFALLAAPGTAQATLTLSAPSAVDEAAGTVTVTVTRTGALLGTATATVGVAAGTTSADADHGMSANPATLRWGGLFGNGPKTATIPIHDDALDEDDETFVVTLSGDETVTGSPATIAITDDEALPALSAGDVRVAEGTGETPTALEVPVTLSAPSGRPVSVTVTATPAEPADGAPPPATKDDDYTPTTGKVTIPAGATSGTLSVPVRADNLDEGDERLLATLGDPVNATVARAVGTATIADDDVPTVAVGILDLKEGTGAPTPYAFPVVLTNPSTRTIEVDLTTADGQAKAPADYAAAAGTIAFAPGETVKTFTVAVAGDAIGEADEGFLVQATAARGAHLPPIPGIGLIRNDDRGATVDPGKVSGASGAGGSGTLRLKRVRGTKGRVLATLSCPVSAGTCTGQVSFFTVPRKRHKIRALRKERNLGTVTYTVKGGGSTSLRLKLKKADRTLLRRARAFRVEGYVVNIAQDGTSQVATATGTVKP